MPQDEPQQQPEQPQEEEVKADDVEKPVANEKEGSANGNGAVEDGKEKKESNIIYVSSSRKRPVSQYRRRIKKLFETHDKVVLQALGMAIMPTVDLSQLLVHSMNCEITKIQTMTTMVPSSTQIKKKMIIEIIQKPTTEEPSKEEATEAS
mmetsp:Transcript_48115/g.79736  ORF Transcript_48115/g.79736 Transcript_48115/m.79736 type:complete len:150 (+) Transcript_48115:44-493(+)